MGIKSTSCECPRGDYKCSHAAAIYVYGIHNLSRTDVECQWKKRKSDSSETLAAKELFPPKQKYKALLRQPNDEDRAYLYKELKDYGKFTGLCWLMSPEPSQQTPCTSAPYVGDAVKKIMDAKAEERLSCFSDIMAMDHERVKKVCEETIGQRDNELWHILRKGRLTASNFGKVIEAKRVTPSLKKQILGEYDLQGVKAIVWGVHHEEDAIQQFSKEYGYSVHQSGIWLDESGFLGASPDGLIGDDSVLEVKCPYTIRNESIVKGLELKTFCLNIDEAKQLNLKKHHSYWHQIQGQLHLTGRKYCYFVIWTRKDMKVLKIEKDSEWAKNLAILKNFYIEHIFPELAGDDQ